MSRILTRGECLKLVIPLYNKAMDKQWVIDKVKKNLSGELSVCKHCQRKYVICCICDTAEERWNNMIEEVKAVSEQRNAVPY
jgi:hypothetical protein